MRWAVCAPGLGFFALACGECVAVCVRKPQQPISVHKLHTAPRPREARAPCCAERRKQDHCAVCALRTLCAVCERKSHRVRRTRQTAIMNVQTDTRLRAPQERADALLRRKAQTRPLCSLRITHPLRGLRTQIASRPKDATDGHNECAN